MQDNAIGAQVLRPGLVKGPWTSEEDEIIVTAINEGVTRWSDIAARIPGRIGKQCRERWFNHLDPNLRKTPWTPAEDAILDELHQRVGELLDEPLCCAAQQQVSSGTKHSLCLLMQVCFVCRHAWRLLLRLAPAALLAWQHHRFFRLLHHSPPDCAVQAIDGVRSQRSFLDAVKIP